MSTSTTSPTTPSGVLSTQPPALPQTTVSGKAESLARRLDEKKEELRAAKATIRDLNEQVTNLKDQIEELSDAALFRDDSTAAVTSSAQAEEDQAKIKDLQTKNENLRAQIVALEKGIADLETPAFLEKMAQYTDEEVKTENEGLVAANKKLQESVTRQNNEIAYLQQQISSHKEDDQKLKVLQDSLQRSQESFTATKTLLVGEIAQTRELTSVLISGLQDDYLKRRSSKTLEDGLSEEAVEADVSLLISEQIAQSFKHGHDAKDDSELVETPTDRKSPETKVPSEETETTGAESSRAPTLPKSTATSPPKIQTSSPKTPVIGQPTVYEDPKPLNAPTQSGNRKAPTTPLKQIKSHFPKAENGVKGLAKAGGHSNVKGHPQVIVDSNDPAAWIDVASKKAKNGPHQPKAPALNIGGQAPTTGFGLLRDGVGNPIEGIYRNPTKHQAQMTLSDKAAVPAGNEIQAGPQSPLVADLPLLSKNQPAQKSHAEVVQTPAKPKTREQKLREAEAQLAAQIAAAARPIERIPDPKITFHPPQQAQMKAEASSSESKSETDRSKEAKVLNLATEPSSTAKLHEDKVTPLQTKAETPQVGTPNDGASIQVPEPEIQAKGKPVPTESIAENESKVTEEAESKSQTKESDGAVEIKHEVEIEAEVLQPGSSSASTATIEQSALPPKPSDNSTPAMPLPVAPKKRRTKRLSDPRPIDPIMTTSATPQPLVQDKSKGEASVGPDEFPAKLASQQNTALVSDSPAQQSKTTSMPTEGTLPASRYSANVSFPTTVLVPKRKDDEWLPTVKGDPYTDNNWRDR